MSDADRGLLAQEYLHLQKVIEDFDGKSLTIKAWSVSFSLVAIGSAFVSHSSVVLLIAGVSALLFWIIESFWKTFQFMHYTRSGQLEEYFRGQRNDLHPLQIGTTWGAEFDAKWKERILKIVVWPYVALPHAFAVAVSLALYVLNLIGIVEV